MKTYIAFLVVSTLSMIEFWHAHFSVPKIDIVMSKTTCTSPWCIECGKTGSKSQEVNNKLT